MIDRAELIGILEEHLSVTDDWGGCKLAAWGWCYSVVVAGIDDAADAIINCMAEKESEGR